MDIDFDGHDITVIFDIFSWEECGKRRFLKHFKIIFQLPCAWTCLIVFSGRWTTATVSTDASQKPVMLAIATLLITSVVSGAAWNKSEDVTSDSSFCKLE